MRKSLKQHLAEDSPYDAGNTWANHLTLQDRIDISNLPPFDPSKSSLIKVSNEGDKIMKEPKVGDTIYVGSSFYISHGEDDFVGGKCIISKVEFSKTLPKEHNNYCFVEVEENRGVLHNYTLLMKEQDKLKKQFGDNKGYVDPDINTPWIEDGDWVDGSIYHGPDIW